MINYKPTKWKELLGEFNAEITDIQIDRNNFYDPSKDNSTENILNISFTLEDPETLESIEFLQKYVPPLVGGNSLFQQLMDLKEIITDLEGGEIDEKEFIGMKCRVLLEKNKKGFSFVKQILPLKNSKSKPAAKPQPVNEEDNDLPFD